MWSMLKYSWTKSETLVFNLALTQLIILENFSTFIHHESLDLTKVEHKLAKKMATLIPTYRLEDSFSNFDNEDY
jgi:hypothetical protein